MKLSFAALLATVIGQDILNQDGTDITTADVAAPADTATAAESTEESEYYYEYYDDVGGIDGRGKRGKKKKKKNQTDSYGNAIITTTEKTIPPNPYAGTTKSTTTTQTTVTDAPTTTTEDPYTTKKPKKPKTPKPPKQPNNPYAPDPNDNGKGATPSYGGPEDNDPKFPNPYGNGNENGNYGSYPNAQDDNKNGLQCFHCDAPTYEECYQKGMLKPCEENAGACMVEIRKRGGSMESVCMGCKQKRACIDNKKQNFLGNFWQCRPKATYGPSVCRQCCKDADCTYNFDPPNYKGWNENLLK